VTAVIGGRDGLDSTEIAMCDLLSQIRLVSVEASEVSLLEPGARAARKGFCALANLSSQATE